VAAFCYPEASRQTPANWQSGGLDSGGTAGEQNRDRTAAVLEGEERAGAWYATQLERERDTLARAMEGFARRREAYFRDVEREAVQLTLQIAGKVLEREARADPLAIAAMVHVALASLQSGTPVTLRVNPAAAQDWRLYFAARAGAAAASPGSSPSIMPSIQEDASLAPADCVVETSMGSAEVSLRNKLQEIEASFQELLAQRPVSSL
jgi:flagellar assembly protein FliH